MRPTSAILREARALLERPNGWCQNSYFQPNAHEALSYCMLGAANMAGCGSPLPSPGIARLYPERASVNYYLDKAAHDMSGSDLFMSAPRFNDTPGRTLAEVLAVYDYAIKLAEAEEDEA